MPALIENLNYTLIKLLKILRTQNCIKQSFNIMHIDYKPYNT